MSKIARKKSAQKSLIFCLNRAYARSLLFVFLWCSIGFAQDPEILYLTWKGDPTTTMTVMWHTTTGNGPSVVYYQHPKESRWQKQEGASRRLNNSSVTVHKVELTQLEPDTEYVFRLEDGEIHRLRTLPDGLTRPVKAAIGGDAYFYKDLFQKMNKEVANHDPDFAIIAGDIAYTEGLRRALRSRYWKINRWEEFFTYWTKDMKTKEGRLIPILGVLGNHDLKEGFDDPYKKEVFYYEFFAFPKKEIPYWVLPVGRELCFFLLDSGHTYPIGGAQTEWLKGSLKQHQDAIYRIPVYHIAAYPSENAYTHRSSKDIRKFWVPLFEKYGVKVSMEHDNHTFKRTFPLWQGEINPNGILYLGDGAWGVAPEKPRDYWYLAKTLQTNNYWLLTIDREKIHAQAFDNDGKLIDQVDITPGK